MPAARRDKSIESAPARKGAPAAPNTAAISQPMRSLTPRPMLLAALSLVFALWMAFLVYLYFKTPRPRPPAQSPHGVARQFTRSAHPPFHEVR